MSTTEKKLELLTSWYVRVKLLRSNEEETRVYPIELIAVILKFLGNIFLIFDIINPKECAHVIKNDGKLIQRGIGEKQFVVASKLAFNEGINEFTIKSFQQKNDAIGIVGGLDEVNNGEWCCYFKFGYMYYGRGAMYIEAKSSNIFPKWGKNDEIKIRIDCNDWNVTFFKNEEKVGESIDIKPNKEYHPFIGCQHKYIKYELLSHNKIV